ncbi:death ligand signal enhancer [Genypterus blacodes]|uniref:death ligand signal enhancer n=1 Tax=Genypterus blacodes TaxID=154954 RepID=UPI003F76BED7
MWRVQALFGRVLNRCYGNTQLRLSQNHRVEDEFINGSVLSTSRHSSENSSQKGEDGERRRKQRTSQFGYAELPRYTALDAVGWGTAAILFMQICRKIHSQFSSSTEPNPGALATPSTLHKCGYRILLKILSRRDVLPRGRTVLCLQEPNQAQSSGQSSSSSSSRGDAGPDSSSEQDHLIAAGSVTDHQTAELRQEFPEESSLYASCPLENNATCDKTERKEEDYKDILSDEERLAEAALNLIHVGGASVPVVLNIIGLENAKSENYEAAFACFLSAAQHGYSKGQFNTAVCYETGRGVGKDKEKALYYYWQAAVGGHRQAQYRYAKKLLTSRGHQSAEELNAAISLLQQAADAGLTEAQVYLASVCSQDPLMDGEKSVHYLKMAAERGDGTALLFLAQCYESGFGVKQNFRTAIEFYNRAAQAGNTQAKTLLMPPSGTEEHSLLRSIRSLSSLAGHIPPSTSPHVPLPLLPHSWSTGSLCTFPSLSSLPLHLHPQAHSAEGGRCQWSVGLG